MRIAVSGNTTFDDYSYLSDKLDEVTDGDDTIIISAHREGPEVLAEKWAFERLFAYEVYHPEPKYTPEKSNSEIVGANIEMLVTFSEGRKDAFVSDLIEQAKRNKIKVKQFRKEG